MQVVPKHPELVPELWPVKEAALTIPKGLRKAQKEEPPMEEPEVVKTHLRDRTILPEMGGSMVGLYWQDLQPSGNQARDDRSPPG